MTGLGSLWCGRIQSQCVRQVSIRSLVAFVSSVLRAGIEQHRPGTTVAAVRRGGHRTPAARTLWNVSTAKSGSTHLVVWLVQSVVQAGTRAALARAPAYHVQRACMVTPLGRPMRQRALTAQWAGTRAALAEAPALSVLRAGTRAALGRAPARTVWRESHRHLVAPATSSVVTAEQVGIPLLAQPALHARLVSIRM